MKYDEISIAAHTFCMLVTAQKHSALKTALERLRPKMIQVAQEILDAWEVDEEGMDAEFGSGGACDAIASAISNIIDLPDINIMDGGQDGDDHAFIIVYNDNEAYAIDIPPYVYEKGGGYSWTKIPNVQLTINDIIIEPIDRNWIE